MEVKQTYNIQCKRSVEYIFHQACLFACPDFSVIGRHTKQFLVFGALHVI